MQNFDQSNGVDFVDAAGFRVVADGWRITGDGKNVADTANGPRAEKSGLQADDVLVAGGEMGNGFEAEGFESAGHNQSVHANAGHGSAVDIDGIHLFGGHHPVDLLVDTLERKALWRIDFHADSEFFCLKILPEFTFRLAFGNRHWF